ncbi:hypothetical protein NQ315_015641 [Exocentrus adspersus]|uniref:Endonuclease/exonuclease/phosphatase domain-containing protein n=1 Tax=Exocentrus adspersus TaxID=1586481 RepID=A0AAV8W3G1_9CUCU|nr:hypothetical protein NQ315_015641 [Exocentrus adspersus]
METEDDKQNEDYKKAYFRETDSGQCELHFFLDTQIPGYGWVKEEIKAVRQTTDMVGSMLQHIRNKLCRIMLDKQGKDLQIEEESDSNEINAFLKTATNKDIKDTIVLKDFTNCFTGGRNVSLQVCDQKFLVVPNAPLIKQIKLPSVLYVGFTIQPSKFHTLNTNNTQSLFSWYKSTDKLNWEKIGKGFRYKLGEDDTGYYIKLVCVPVSPLKVRGPRAHAVSEDVVIHMGQLPTCPFERRHEFTREKCKGLKFRVVSYNILADRYARDNESYTYCPPKALAIEYRKQLILKELLGYKGDIICLQEVDDKQYKEYFKHQFTEAGYGSVFNRKGNRLPEGLACVFNKTRYTLLESKHIVFSTEIERNNWFSYLWNVMHSNEDVMELFLNQPTSLQVIVLKDKLHNKCVIVGNTHLYYRPEANHIRLLQVNMATAYLSLLRRRYLKDGRDMSVIFCGDFNSSPEQSLFSYMVDGHISPEHEDSLMSNIPSSCILTLITIVIFILVRSGAALYHEFVFESACGTPKYTNYTAPYKGCLDYIFIESNRFAVTRVVPLMDEEELSLYEGLPNEFYPSDHLALVVDLKYKTGR